MARRPAAVTLVDALWPRASTAQDMVRSVVLVIGFSALIALSARIAIPLPFVPFTLQPMAVLLTGALLGSRLGALALIAYLAEGLAGMPVFANGMSAWSLSPSTGLPVILSTSAGYLYAYPLAALAVGWLVERGWGRDFGRSVFALGVGLVVIYVGGTTWLARFIGPELAVLHGVVPFVVWDAIKVVIAASVLPSGWRLLGRRDV